MSKPTKIQTSQSFNSLTGHHYNAQSKQFPGLSVNGPNEDMAKFIFAKNMKGKRKSLYKRK